MLYEYLGTGMHNFAAYASYVREDRRGHLIATGGATNRPDAVRLPLQRVLLLQPTYGFTIARFSKHGQPDPVLYSFSPTAARTRGHRFPGRLHAVWQRGLMGPPLRERQVACSTRSTTSRRRHHQYDGTGRNASDNNTLTCSMVGDLAMGEFYEVARDFATTVLVLIRCRQAQRKAAGDATAAPDIFRQNCAMCHSPEPGQNWSVRRCFRCRPSCGQYRDFSYSSAMKSADRLDRRSAEAYLKAPASTCPASNDVSGPDDEQDRENVVAFLATLRNAAAAGRARRRRLRRAGATRPQRFAVAMA